MMEMERDENQHIETITITKDIYDRFGRIYVSKGKTIKLSPDNIEKFKKLGILEEILSQGNEKQDADLQKMKETTDAFEHKYKMGDAKLFSEAIEDVHEVIFKGKTHGWYTHLNTLVNHLEWYYAHSINVAIIAALMARKLNYTDKQIEEIILGALFHDIGMIFVPPDFIWCEEGKLTEEAKNMIRKHCELGAMAIHNIDFPDRSKTMIKQHHERLDGSGYPLGLKEDEIIEEAKIIMVAETFDSYTSYRPNREQKQMDEVLALFYEQEDKYPRRYVQVLEEVLGKRFV